MRAQTSVEFLVIFMFVLAALVPLWLYTTSTTQGTEDDIQITYAHQAVEKLRRAADLVYIEGPPAMITDYVHIPRNLDQISLSGNEILFRLRLLSGGLSDIYATTLGTLQGNISTTPGIHLITVRAQDTFVNITE
jgi:hypothetical protein